MSAGKARSAPLTRGEARPKKQSGFTYIGVMIVVAIMGGGLAAFGQITSHATQREKEAELLFRGDQFRAAIESYYKKEQRYPKALADLVEDKRFPMPVRHLRRIYDDPMTGKADWGVVEVPGGAGVMGVYSKADAAPIKTGNFPLAYQAFADAAAYSDWKFVHSPPGLPAAVEKSKTK